MTTNATLSPKLTPKQRGVKRSNDHSPEPPPDLPRVRTMRELAELISCSPKQIEKLIKAGELKVFSVGCGQVRQSLRITDEAIAAFIERRTVKPSVCVTDPDGFGAGFAAYLANKGKAR
ncbi:helix-turn-helix domain-containing protein [Methylobacterium radiotolerans]